LIWTIEFDSKAGKDLEKMDKNISKNILRYLSDRVLQHGDPRILGKELKGNLAGFWRYRVENHRIICSIEDDRLVVLVVRIGHRKEIY